MTSDPSPIPVDSNAKTVGTNEVDRSGKIPEHYDRPFAGFSGMHIEFCHALAQQFKRTTRYVAFSHENEATYSIEYVRLLLDTCSEIEALAKLFCKKLTGVPLKKKARIDDWREIIVTNRPNFSGVKITVFSRFTFQPWKAWEDSPPTNPSWWGDYNHVKHDRTANFRRANLGNVVTAVCGLMVFASRLYPYHYHGLEQPWFRLG